jgi:excisionase family DNA binding protein
MPIRDLVSHQARYVTIAELAEYWGVSRQQIYKRIDSGALEAIQLGSRLVRVRTVAALEYERNARVGSAARANGNNEGGSSRTDGLPKAIGLKRVFKKSGVA